MATREEMERQQLAQQQPVAKPNQQGLYTNLEGISDASRQNLNYYSQGYTPSQQVQQAQSYLQGVMDKQPGEYQNSYAGQIKDLYNQIMNRPKFSYDVNKDPLFKSYKDQYIVNGQRAMQDTIGNAAALTGGYGNSWGTTAGYQAYQRYLQALNGVIPELEQRAFERYGAEGDQLQNNLSLAMGLEGQDYGRYRDTLGDWQADRAYARSAYDTEAGRDLESWQNMLRLIQNQAAMENSDYWNRQDFDFQLRQYEDALNKARGGGPTPTRDTDTTDTQDKEPLYYMPIPLGETEGKYAQLPGGLAGPLTRAEWADIMDPDNMPAFEKEKQRQTAEMMAAAAPGSPLLAARNEAKETYGMNGEEYQRAEQAYADALRRANAAAGKTDGYFSNVTGTTGGKKSASATGANAGSRLQSSEFQQAVENYDDDVKEQLKKMGLH